MIKRLVYEDIENLIKKQGIGSYLCSMSREHLTRRLNEHLREYGKKVNKELTSHSCRISFVTRFVEKFGIEVARQMVGHVNVSTTQNYSRSNLTARQRAGLLNEVLSSARKEGNRVVSAATEQAVSSIIDERNE